MIYRFTRRILIRFSAAIVVATCLIVGSIGGSTTPGMIATSPPPTSAHLAVVRGESGSLCQSTAPQVTKPLAVMVGASITAGYGSTSPKDAWPYRLAAGMGWRVVVRGVPGAGYVHKGWHGGGPLIRELLGLDLSTLHPSFVFLQAGHDDSREPTPLLAPAVAATVGLVEREAPVATLVLVTVFPGGVPTVNELRTNRTIIATARETDVHALVINPIAQDWHYRTISDHLHPTDSGDRWIARRIERDLTADGITSSLTCSTGTGKARIDDRKHPEPVVSEDDTADTASPA